VNSVGRSNAVDTMKHLRAKGSRLVIYGNPRCRNFTPWPTGKSQFKIYSLQLSVSLGRPTVIDHNELSHFPRSRCLVTSYRVSARCFKRRRSRPVYSWASSRNTKGRLFQRPTNIDKKLQQTAQLQGSSGRNSQRVCMQARGLDCQGSLKSLSTEGGFLP
jgi:hypothetical protein